mmetsp:Transcript_84369/g.163849  ORF Transcript_84369/g.163849 Transcript_84369/m.163849 type:complete len:215 (+) Transcript_84369:644-1288(+)
MGFLVGRGGSRGHQSNARRRRRRGRQREREPGRGLPPPRELLLGRPRGLERRTRGRERDRGQLVVPPGGCPGPGRVPQRPLARLHLLVWERVLWVPPRRRPRGRACMPPQRHGPGAAPRAGRDGVLPLLLGVSAAPGGTMGAVHQQVCLYLRRHLRRRFPDGGEACAGPFHQAGVLEHGAQRLRPRARLLHGRPRHRLLHGGCHLRHRPPRLWL